VIDWWMVGTNSLWVLGLSILLAAFSYHSWLATEIARPRRDAFDTRSWRLAFAGGMMLTCAGWGLSQGRAWWDRTLWTLLAAWFSWRLWSEATR
jgi:hypothetical protein